MKFAIPLLSHMCMFIYLCTYFSHCKPANNFINSKLTTLEGMISGHDRGESKPEEITVIRRGMELVPAVSLGIVMGA